jgi:hypothetical protein
MNQKSPLQVGIVGASAKSGWARMSHVPAIKGLGLKLAAVAASTLPT